MYLNEKVYFWIEHLVYRCRPGKKKRSTNSRFVIMLKQILKAIGLVQLTVFYKL